MSKQTLSMPSSVLRRILSKSSAPEVPAAIATLFMLGLLLTSPYFLNATNLSSLQTSMGPIVIVAIGMTCLFIIGVFDLSVGATMALAALVSAAILSTGAGPVLAIVGGLGVGAIMGAVNGALVAGLNLNPLIVTLGIYSIGRGIIDLMIGGGRTKPWMYVSGEGGLSAIGEMFVGPLHISLVLGLVLAVVVQIGLTTNAVGRNLFFAGDNPKAARTLGIPVGRIKFAGFVFSGILAALAGILIASRTGLASRHIGTGVELEVIIACLIGGSTIVGGRGSVIGSLLGVLFITMINNAFNLFEVAPQWQKFVVGLVLVIVISVDGIRLLAKKKSG